MNQGAPGATVTRFPLPGKRPHGIDIKDVS